MKKIKAQLLHTADCHIWKTSLRKLQEALKAAKLKVKCEVILITSKAQAEKMKFTGSPTILINGSNVDPMRRMVKKFITEGCAPYFWQGKSYEYPPKEMILAALTGANS